TRLTAQAEPLPVAPGQGFPGRFIKEIPRGKIVEGKAQGTDYLSRAEASGKFYLIGGLLHYVVLNIHRPLRVVEVSRHRVGLLLVKVTKLRNFTGAAHQQLLREFLSRLRVDGTQQYPVVG